MISLRLALMSLVYKLGFIMDIGELIWIVKDYRN